MLEKQEALKLTEKTETGTQCTLLATKGITLEKSSECKIIRK